VFPLSEPFKPTVLSTATWEAEVLRSEQPVLVDFWASWCPPCRAIGPVIDALAGEYAGRVKIGKLDVDAHPEVAGRYGIRSIPSLLVFRGGHVEERRIGALPLAELKGMIETFALREAAAGR
jgi:thioredoxin